MADTRFGIGFDAHRFGGPGPVVLCGVPIDHPVGLEGTSDADVAAHAVADAILGAAALGDIGMHFPSSDPQWEGADSLDLIRRCATMAYDRGLEIANIDLTIVAQDLRISPHREEMRVKLADAVRVAVNQVSVKATTTDRMGSIGAGEGIAAYAGAALRR